MDVTTWMPQGMDEYERQAYADQYPDNPHGAAAAAWEDWAAQLDDPDPSTARVQSLSTGVQTVTYRAAGSARSQALERARWHRARASAYSVAVGPRYATAPEAVWTADPGLVDGEDDSANESVWTTEEP